MPKTRILLSALAILLAVGLVELTHKAQKPKGAIGTATKPHYGGTLVVGMTGDVDSFNPLLAETDAAGEIGDLILLNLADMNERSEFVAELAESWEFSKDRLHLTYHLRQDALWADGVPITAEDVAFTYALMRDSLVGSPHRGSLDFVQEVKPLGPHAIRLTFTEAYPEQLFDTAVQVVPKHILRDVPPAEIRSHPFGRQPLASGPFQLKRWVSRQYIELVPNERYFGGRPYLDRVIFKIVPDVTNLLVQLETGEIDMMIGVPPKDVKRLREHNPDVQIYPVSGRVYYYVGWNEQKEFFKSAQVRRALTMAINRRAIIDALLYGYGRPCLGPLPPLIAWAYNDRVREIPFDVKQAKAFLAEAGWADHDGDGWLDKDGQRFEFALKTNAGNALRADLAVIIQDQLKQVGVLAKPELVEWNTLLDQLREGQFDACISGWSTSLNIDPTPIFHSSSRNLFNHVSYANPEADRLMEQGRKEFDQAKAAPIWHRFQEVVYEDQPYTFLFWVDRLIAVRQRFANVKPIPLSALYQLEKWYVVPDTETSGS